MTDSQVLVRRGLSPSAVGVCSSAISVAHLERGYPSPATSAKIEEFLARTRCQPAPPAEPSTLEAAATADDIARLLAPMRVDQSLRDARDTAVILISWSAGLDIPDLMGMRLEHQHVTSSGLLIRIDEPVTTDTSHTRYIARNRAHTAATPPAMTDSIASTIVASTDAVVAWERWRDVLAAHAITTGPAWRGTDRHDRTPSSTGLSQPAYGRIVTRRCAAAGLLVPDGPRWTIGSLARGSRARVDPAAAERQMQDDTAILLAQLGAAATREFIALAAREDLTPMDVGILRIVADTRDAHINQRALAERVSTPPPRLAGRLDKLEQRGLVRRAQGADRRSFTPQLTAAGQELLARLDAAATSDDRQLFVGLDHAERAQLHRLLQRMAEARGLPTGVYPGHHAKTSVYPGHYPKT